jgi:phospholipid transport system substrate-binding protein
MTLSKIIRVSVLLLLVAFVSMAYGRRQPMEALKPHINNILMILKDPQYKDACKKKLQRDKIFEIVRALFDFPTITKLALGKYRKSFTPEQLKDLTNVFTDLLGKTYINKMLSEFKGEEVLYIAEDMLTEKKAIVKTKVIREKGEMAVNYRMHFRNGIWSVYDVKVEGVSLVKNYRNQFSQILFKEKPEMLIQKLQEKLKEQETETDVPQP